MFGQAVAQDWVPPRVRKTSFNRLLTIGVALAAGQSDLPGDTLGADPAM